MQPTPYIDEQTGEHFYNPRQVALMVKGFSLWTVWNWAKDGGVTSFGFDLAVRREPILHHRSGNDPARVHRQTRMLIPEQKVLALKEILQAAGRTAPGPWTRDELATLEAIARRHPASELATFHL
jgi:hypothetical protein